MKKRIMTIALCLCLLAVAAMGTIAYFTDSDSDVNVMVTGNVSIIQSEKGANGAAYVDGQKLIPSVEDADGNPSNNVIDKVVTVTNVGSEDAYIRTFILLEANKDDEGNVGSMLVGVDVNTDNYTGSCLDGYVTIGDVPYEAWMFVYDTELAAGATSEPSLLKVWLEPETTQEDMTLVMGNDGKYNVIVFTQAVQKAGFDGPDAAFETVYCSYDDIDAGVIADWAAKANIKTQGY